MAEQRLTEGLQLVLVDLSVGQLSGLEKLVYELRKLDVIGLVH